MCEYCNTKLNDLNRVIELKPALRERAIPVWIFIDSYNGHYYLRHTKSKDLEVKDNLIMENHYVAQIKFCPFCGRDLEQGA